MRKLSKLTVETLHCPILKDLPPPPEGKTGWPWTEESTRLPDRMPDGRLWPKISIVTPSYNHGRFIEECIRSVLLQGYPDLEYIIIDGGSTDDTVDIVKKYEPWLTYWVSEPDKGQSHAINKGLKKSTGQLFNWHNSDDVLTPNSLAATAAVMAKYSQAGYAHGYRIIIDDKGTVQGNTKHSYGNKIAFLPELWTIVSNLKAGCQPGCLMNREIVVRTGMIDEDLRYVMDVDVLSRIALEKPPLYIPFPVVYLRVYSGIKSLQWNAQRAKERIAIADKIFNHDDLPTSIKNLRKQSFATAHQFAWRGYIEAKMYTAAFWHLLLDVFYSSGRGWRKRLANLHKYSISDNKSG